jgi:hypothetical protein
MSTGIIFKCIVSIVFSGKLCIGDSLDVILYATSARPEGKICTELCI